MASFWQSENKIPIVETQTSVPSENGLAYSAGQVIQLMIPPSIKFFQPQQTFLKADVLIAPDATAPTRLGLDAELGGQVLVRDIRIYTGNKNVLLEEINNYNTLCAVRYDYDTNENMKAKRAMTEGSLAYNSDCRSTQGGTKSNNNDIKNNPYFRSVPVGSDENAAQVATDTFLAADSYVKAQVCLPLHTGIFQNDKIFPNLLTDGLYIEILLEDNSRVFRQMDQVSLERRPQSNPYFHSTNGSFDDKTGSIAVGAGGAVTTIYIQRRNNQTSVSNFPFVVGEIVRFANNATINASSVHTEAGAEGTIKEISFDTGAEIADGGLIKVVFEAALDNDSTAIITAHEQWVLYSDSVKGNTNYNATYTMSNVELVVQQLDMGPQYEADMMRRMREGGVISMDFLSVTNYKYSQVKQDTVANIRLPINNTRAKSIICVPTSAEVTSLRENAAPAGTYLVSDYLTNAGGDVLNEDLYIRSNRTGLVGCSDFITDYNFLYDGRLACTRNVRCSKTSGKRSVDAQHLVELEKALVQANITPNSFLAFNDNFVLGRGLATGTGVYNAVGKDFSLQVNYQGKAQTVNKLWHNFVFHIRRMVIKGNDIMMEV
tara:strand:+ start:1131 stop:2936 length:1806 start_codon:yes stop_codon:yes gene_type:complete